MKLFVFLMCYFTKKIVWLVRFGYRLTAYCIERLMDKYMELLFSQSVKWKVSFKWPFIKPEPFTLWAWYNFFWARGDGSMRYIFGFTLKNFKV